jgi:hypothetical protein
MPPFTEVFPRTPLFTLWTLLMVSAASAPAGDSATTVAPFPGSSEYIEQGMLIGAKSGTHRRAFTTRFKGEPIAVSRPLTVHPESNLNGDFSGNNAPRLGPRELPTCFGGFTAVVYAMKEPAQFTTRVQFQNGPSGRNDFVNLNFYVESNKPHPAGIEFSFTGAILFPAGEAGAPLVVPIEAISQVRFQVASQRLHARVSRVLVRDADSGEFFVSENFAIDNSASIALSGSKWAKINPSDLTLVEDYRLASFRHVDHIGVFATIPVTETTETLTAYGVICNLALHSFEYTLSRLDPRVALPPPR